jgi:hypothetical protein
MSNNSNRDFSLTGYKSLIRTFIKAGYKTCFFKELDLSKSQLILRHDVDFSLKAALDIAKVEAELGVSSHFYVLLRTEFYNLCSPNDLKQVQALAELGHNVGLHFDASLYDQQLDKLEAAIASECNILEAIMGQDVTSISFHRPAQKLLGLNKKLAGRQHAYEPRFFSEIAYVTDSQGLFRYGHPLDHEAFKARKAMQLVTHPIWWPKYSSADKMALLDEFLSRRMKLLVAETAANCKPFALRISEEQDSIKERYKR